MNKTGCMIIILMVIFVGLGLYYISGLKPEAMPTRTIKATQNIQNTQAPSRSATAAWSATPEWDIAATINAADQLKVMQTKTAEAEETAAANQLTAQAWQVTQHAMQLESDAATTEAKETLVAADKTATPLARIQQHEAELEDTRKLIQPIWDWSGVIAFWFVMVLIITSLNRIIPAVAERIRPAHVYTEQVQHEQADNQDQDTGREFRIQLVTRTNGGYSNRRMTIPCSLEQFSELADGIVASGGKDLTEARWVRLKKGENKPFSRRQFIQVRNVLLKEKLIMAVDPRDSQKGFIVSEEGMAFFINWNNGLMDDVTFETTPPPSTS